MVNNPIEYFLDWLGLIKKQYLLYLNNVKVILRGHTIDRWVATENLILDSYGIKALRHNAYDTIIDIGGNIGTFTLNVQRIFPKAKIYVFEPDKNNYQVLLNNIKANGLEKRVRSFNCAISSQEDKTIPIYMHHDSANISTINKSQSSFPAENQSFRHISKLFGKKTLLKIDIEGGEYDIFIDKNTSKIKKINTIVLEFHNLDKKRNISFLKKYFKKNNMKYAINGCLMTVWPIG